MSLKKQNLILTIFLTLVPFQSFAINSKCPSPQSFTVEDKKENFCINSAPQALFSSTCFDQDTKKCGARLLLESAVSKNITLEQADLRGGKNPGSSICSKIGGKVQYGTIEGGSQITFCKAQDNTLVDCNALANHFYQSKN